MQSGYRKLELSFEPGDGDAVRVTMLARANAPFYHYGFDGYIMHDFSTMRHKDAIAIDWEHDTIIGRSLGLDIGPEGLRITAELTGHNAQSREVITMLKAGIPLEASIAFRDYDADCVPQGGTAHVNGREFADLDGDLYIIKNWTLTSCAICKEGYDPQTETNMLNFLKAKKTEALSAETAPEAPAAEPPTAEEEKAPEAEIPAEVTETPAETPEATPAAPAQLTVKEEIARFTAAFGQDLGFAYLSAGLSFEEARDRAVKELRETNDALKAEVAELQARLDTPAPFTPAEQFAAPKINGLTKTQAKLYSLIQR